MKKTRQSRGLFMELIYESEQNIQTVLTENFQFQDKKGKELRAILKTISSFIKERYLHPSVCTITKYNRYMDRFTIELFLPYHQDNGNNLPNLADAVNFGVRIGEVRVLILPNSAPTFQVKKFNPIADDLWEKIRLQLLFNHSI